jgi:hypothetical protein
LDVGYDRTAIVNGIKAATDPQFRRSLAGLVNPYGSGEAVPIIIKHLKSTPLGDRLIRKKFHDLRSS